MIVIGLARQKETTLLHLEANRTYTEIRVVERRLDTREKIQIKLNDTITLHNGHVLWSPLEVKPGDWPGGKGLQWDIKIPRVK